MQKLRSVACYEGKDKDYKSTGIGPRKYLSLFEVLEISRPSRWSKELGQFHKLDEYLKLPIGSYC